MKLNLGCGANKIEGFVNVDLDEELNPDEVWDFAAAWPKANASVDEIVMYHVIEHIQKPFHDLIISEAHRVLKPGGLLSFSYPEFLKCVENWKTNYKGQREFWEATIYGRQSSDFDYHVAIMDTDQFKAKLVSHGFEILYAGPEPIYEYNSVIRARKDRRITYEDCLVMETFGAN